jgi:hypothetical protein
MVKNYIGGSKTKGVARKNFNTVKNKVVRLPTNEFEHIAWITKIYGGGRCQVMTQSGIDIQCIIRKKFSGRSKKQSIVGAGSAVLIGLYDWEKPNYKTCDVIEVYSADEIDMLRNIASVKYNDFENNMRTITGERVVKTIVDDANIEFTNTATDTDFYDSIDARVKTELKTIESTVPEEEDDWIDVNDI